MWQEDRSNQGTYCGDEVSLEEKRSLVLILNLLDFWRGGEWGIAKLDCPLNFSLYVQIKLLE